MHDANIAHAVKIVTNKKSIIEFTRVISIGFEGGGSPVFNQQSPFCIAEGVVCMAKGQLLQCNEGLIITKKEPFCYEKDSFYVY